MPRLALLLALLVAGYTWASDSYDERMASLQKVGEARYNYMFWHIYDVVLYAPEGSYTQDSPYALSLTYARGFSGASIADRSSKLIRSRGFKDEMRLAAWHTQMDQIFPDVDAGSTLTGFYTADGQTIFYQDGEEVGRIRDPLFGECFFGIWLDESTTAPEIRLQLLGSRSD